MSNLMAHCAEIEERTVDMKRQSNVNRKPNEAATYFTGEIEIDGEKVRVLFTEQELKRPRDRAKRQPEEFSTSNEVGVFATIKGWFK